MSQMQILQKTKYINQNMSSRSSGVSAGPYGGSAIPVIKTGYRILAVDSADTASQIVLLVSGSHWREFFVLLFRILPEKSCPFRTEKIFKHVIPVCFVS